MMISVFASEMFFPDRAQNSFTEMFRLGSVTGVPFIVFAHVNQNGFRILFQPRLRLFRWKFPERALWLRWPI